MTVKADLVTYNKEDTMKSLRKKLAEAQKKLAAMVASNNNVGADKLREIIANLEHTLGV